MKLRKKLAASRDEHPWLIFYHTGKSCLPPENKMPRKQMRAIRQFANATGELYPSLRNYNPSAYGPESIHE